MKSTLEKVVLAAVVIVCLLGLYHSLTDLTFFEKRYLREDGFIEWLTVIGLMLGAFICFYRSRVLSPFRDKIFVRALILQSFLFVLFVGQEISWGQRLLNLGSLASTDKSINRVLFGLTLGVIVGFYFLIAPVLYNKMEGVKVFVNRFAIPVPRLIHILCYVALLAMVQFIAGKHSGEILEFGGVWIFLLMIYHPLNREVFSRKTLDR